MGFETVPHAPEPAPRDYEREIDALLESLPEEVADRFYASHQDDEPEAEFKALFELAHKRKTALSRSPDSRATPEHILLDETRPLAVVRLLEQIERGEHEKLGQGGAGRVIASIRYPNLCYKVMFPQEQVPLGTNDISDEAEIQGAIASMGERFGVRAPRVFSFVSENGNRAIRMERLFAVSLRDVLRGAPLPKAFEPKRFFDSLRKFVRYMHEQGYYHRDLQDGNILIDNETGQPYLIDFGLSAYSAFPEDVYRVSVVRGGREVKNMLQDDEVGIDAAERQLLNHLNKNTKEV
ncbi:MAG TPA: hypothetical protein VFL98_02190 [Candidatus Paceibacterota bacterium]|nr:hypothetical protein [Candidatus Paceibacterota bacterium]